MARVEIVEESVATLAEYAKVPATFLVERLLTFDEVDGDLTVSERIVDEPYRKDYDTIQAPMTWPARCDTTNWGFLGAFLGGDRVGGAAIAFDSAGLEILRGRKDLAVLWDLRVHPDFRRRGIGSALFRAVEHWATSKKCTELKIETQNSNLTACRFYERQGCALQEINPDAYRTLPDEVQLIWSKAPRTLV